MSKSYLNQILNGEPIRSVVMESKRDTIERKINGRLREHAAFELEDGIHTIKITHNQDKTITIEPRNHNFTKRTLELFKSSLKKNSHYKDDVKKDEIVLHPEDLLSVIGWTQVIYNKYKTESDALKAEKAEREARKKAREAAKKQKELEEAKKKKEKDALRKGIQTNLFDLSDRE